jgi:hypothetical protein
MTPFLAAANEADLEPEVIAYCVPPLKNGGGRVTPLFRIVRVGAVFFVEGMMYARKLSAEGKEVITETWTKLAISKGPDARRESFAFMQDANKEAIRISGPDAKLHPLPG